jgi:hypothetical protein
MIWEMGGGAALDVGRGYCGAGLKTWGEGEGMGACGEVDGSTGWKTVVPWVRRSEVC